ncbi:GmrSD restriction endonuclease domain-containing protein [Flavobacterium aquidurense]|uniref:GmrSD restriction endonuclease domain-containing protein n=1 Tax=Flavobacterium aquidurense TaxID=362413 RepID=UPI003723D5D1
MEQQKTFGEIIKSKYFKIPDYQRAYSWGEKQLIPFINDILEYYTKNEGFRSENKNYYLGHYILERNYNFNEYEIIDGQQRITTIYLFLIACNYIKKDCNYYKKINLTPVSYDVEGFKAIIKTLETNTKNIDLAWKELLDNIPVKTMSFIRMVEAVRLFIDSFSGDSNLPQLELEKINRYIDVIDKAHCSIAIYNDKAVASQIFELHNTRGIALFETEKVKALLMKNIYINSSNPQQDIEKIQKSFAKIFEMEERASNAWLRGNISLDNILMHHLQAVDDGSKEKDFGSPFAISGDNGSFEYVRKEFLKKQSKDEILNYAMNLAVEFEISIDILVNKIPNADINNHLVGDILLLDKNRSIIFLLRAFRWGNPMENKLIERWENFLICYEIIYWNGYYYNAKTYRNKFHSFYRSINKDSKLYNCNKLLCMFFKGEKNFSYHWKHLGNNAKELFEIEKQKWLINAYGWNKTAYLLYKFEIENGADFNIIRKNIYKNDSLSIDHIVARSIEWRDLGVENYLKDKDHADLLWKKIMRVINGIGNLSLSTSKANSSDSNALPVKHLNSFKKFGLVTTVEQVRSWTNPEEFASKIEERSESIRAFIYDKIINNQDIWD